MESHTVAVAPSRPVRAPRWRRLFPPELVAVAAGIAAWELVGRLAAFHFLPPFTQVMAAGVKLVRTGVIGTNLLASLAALGIGLGISIGIGVPIGMLMGRYALVEIAIGPYVSALLTAPSLVFVPVLFIFFGVSDATRVAVVFLYSVFVIIVNTATGVRTASPPLIEMARAFGANSRQLFWRVILPDALPLIMAGVRLGVGRAVKGMINGEMFIAYVGLGAELRRYGGAFDAASVLAILLVVLVVAALAGWGVQQINQRLTWWAD